MKFCNHCGAPLERRVPEGDNRERFVCTACRAVHYLNPRLVVGTLVEIDNRVLLCRRAIEPRCGYWTLPAGFLEHGESASAGAARETLEEACAHVDVGDPFVLVSAPFIDQVHLIFRACLAKPGFAAGQETSAVGLFAEDEIPWDELAFRSIRLALEHYFRDRRAGRFAIHEEVLERPVQPIVK